MKKLIKSLAVLLALVLVLGTVSAAAADTKVSLTAKTKTLFIGGSTGTKADGTKCATGETKQMKNMVKNFDKATMNIYVSSDNEEVVSVNKSTIKAEKLGTANVSVVVTTKDGEVLLNSIVKVTNKKNATDDTLVVTGVEEGATYKVTDVLTVTTPRAGVYTDTPSIKANSENVVIAEAGVRVWNVSFLKAGDYELTATTTQSDVYDGVTATKTVKFTVEGASYTGVKQTAFNKFQMAFDSSIANIDVAGAVQIFTKAGDTVIPNVKTIAKVTKEDTKATVEVYGNFVKGTEYFVQFGEEVFSFKGVDLSTTAVASFAINAATVTTDDTTLSITAYNADGVVLPVSASDLDVQFEALEASDSAYVDSAQIHLYNVNDYITVKAYYNTTDETTWTVTPHEAVNTMTFVRKAAQTVTEDGTPYITASAAATKDTDKLAVVAVGDTAYFDVFYKVVKLDGTLADPAKWTSLNTATVTYSFYSNNEKVFVMSGNQIVPVAAGTAYVIVNKATINDDSTVTNETVGAYPVTISAERKAKSFALSLTKTNLNIAATADDSLGVKVKVVDQYGAPVAGKTFGVKNLATCKTYTIDTTTAATNADGEVTYTIVNSDVDVASGKTGTIILTFTNDDFATKSQNINIPVANFGADKTATAYQINGLDITTLDTGLTATSDITKDPFKTYSVSVDEMFNGYKLNDNTAFSALDKLPAATATTATTEWKYILKNNTTGTVITANTDNVTLGAGTIDITPVKTVGGEIKKLAAGTYTLTLYKLAPTSGSNDRVSVRKLVEKTFTITNNQVKAVAKAVKSEYSNLGGANSIADFKECFEITLNGKKVGEQANIDITDVKSKVDNTGAVVYTAATLTLTINGGTLDVEVTGLPVVIKKQ